MDIKSGASALGPVCPKSKSAPALVTMNEPAQSTSVPIPSPGMQDEDTQQVTAVWVTRPCRCSCCPHRAKARRKPTVAMFRQPHVSSPTAFAAWGPGHKVQTPLPGPVFQQPVWSSVLPSPSSWRLLHQWDYSQLNLCHKTTVVNGQMVTSRDGNGVRSLTSLPWYPDHFCKRQHDIM